MDRSPVVQRRATLRRLSLRCSALIFAIGTALSIHDTSAQQRTVPATSVRDPAEACRQRGGEYTTDPNSIHQIGEATAAVTVELPGAHWCLRLEGRHGGKFDNSAQTAALYSAARSPTLQDYARSFFLVAGAYGPSVIPLSMLRDLDGLRAALEIDLRAGLAPNPDAVDRPGLLNWDHGPRFQTVHAEVGVLPPGSRCVPTRIVYEERAARLFPAGTVLQFIAESRYCLAPLDSATPVLAYLHSSERRLADDPEADKVDREWSGTVDRYISSLRFGP